MAKSWPLLECPKCFLFANDSNKTYFVPFKGPISEITEKQDSQIKEDRILYNVL